MDFEFIFIGVLFAVCGCMASLTGHFIGEKKFKKANISVFVLIVTFFTMMMGIVLLNVHPTEPVANETIVIEEGGTTAIYDRNNTKITVETDGKAIVYDVVEPTTEN